MNALSTVPKSFSSWAKKANSPAHGRPRFCPEWIQALVIHPLQNGQAPPSQGWVASEGWILVVAPALLVPAVLVAHFVGIVRELIPWWPQLYCCW